jgi:hypothetical protein
MADEILEMVTAMTNDGNSTTGFSAAHLAKHSEISLVLASERLFFKLDIYDSLVKKIFYFRLRMAEEQGKLCRDDTIEGLFFYPNNFNYMENVEEKGSISKHHCLK